MKSASLIPLLLCADPAWAQMSDSDSNTAGPGPSPVQLETEKPEGFDDLTSVRETVFTLFVDSQSLGPIDVEIAPGTVRFTNPAALISLLPPLRDPAAVNSALKQPLDTNAGLSCSPVPFAGCGRIDPAVLGVVLSRDAGRIDLFLGGGVRGEARPYLPIPLPGPPTLAGALGLQYSVSQRGIDFSLQPRLVLGLGRSHFAADATVSNRTTSLDRAYFRHVGNHNALSAGLIPASTFNFAYFDRLVGVRFGSSNETRIERGNIADTPILLDTPLQGRVEIRRDGVLLDTQRVSPGRVTIDTTSLPGGAYPLTLTIIDATGERTETRFFVRAPGLPGYGDTEYFVEGGWNTAFRGADSGFLPSLLSPTLRAGINVRAGPQLGLSARGEVSAKRRLAELGVTFLESNWRTSGTVGATDTGEFAESINASGNLNHFNWSLDARAVQGRAGLFGINREKGLGRTYQQLSAFGGYSGKAFSLNTGIVWRRDTPGKSNFTVLPSARWTISQKQGRRWELETSGSYSAGNWSIRAGLRLSLYGSRSSLTMFAGTEGRHGQGDTQFQPTGSADWSSSRETDLGPLQLRAGVSQQVNRLSGRLGANLITTYAQLGVDAQIERQFNNSSVYGRIDTSFGFAANRLAFGSSSFTGSGVVAEAKDAEKGTEFSVRALGANGRAIKGSSPVFVSTTPFSQGEIGINVIGGTSSFDTRNEPAVFFPGTVKRLVRSASHITVVYAQLLDSVGNTVKNASVESGGSIAETDVFGNLQMEVRSNATLRVERDDGTQCSVKVPTLDKSAVFVNLGVLNCTIEPKS